MDRVKGRGNAGLWTPRKTKGGFSTAPTGPWKSLHDSHIPTAPAGRGKVENQKAGFPLSHLLSLLSKPRLRKEAWQRSLRSRLQAHSSMRKCCRLVLHFCVGIGIH